MKKRSSGNDFVSLNRRLTSEVMKSLDSAGSRRAVIAEAPPGAGKSTLAAAVAKGLADADKRQQIAIVTQTNEQADDMVRSLSVQFHPRKVARLVGGDGPSAAVGRLAAEGKIVVATKSDHVLNADASVIVSTARKWQYERSRRFEKGKGPLYRFALVDEAYQMRSDMLLGISHLFDTLFCIGDPGQLDPFTVVDDSIWKGLPYSPARSALATLRAFHEDIQPLQLPTSWRLPESAAGIVSEAFYPESGFNAGTTANQRALLLGKASRVRRAGSVDLDAVLNLAAATGWAYVELAEKFAPKTDLEVAQVLAELVDRLLRRGADVVDELVPAGRKLTPDKVAVVTAHNDQVHAVRFALSQLERNPDTLVVSTANKIQGREYDVVLVWHPLAGRRDATAFHLESGRMCVMLSRHRQACIVVGRAGAERLLEEFPDSAPVFIDEPEKFPDGWQANHLVLQHLLGVRVG